MRELTLDGLLEAFAARTPAPGGGAGAGVAAALGAALAEMGARFAGFEEDARRAAELRALALELAEGDAAGYAPVLEALRLPADTPGRAERVRAALSAAADVPLALAEAAAEVAALARRVAADGPPGARRGRLDGRRAGRRGGAGRRAARGHRPRGAPDDPRRARAEAAAAASAARLKARACSGTIPGGGRPRRTPASPAPAGPQSRGQREAHLSGGAHGSSKALRPRRRWGIARPDRGRRS